MNASLAFVFPGQGSQSVGMLSELAAKHTTVTETFAQASETLGFDLWRLVSDGPETELNRTDITQPALLTASVALWRLWADQGGAAPAYLAGHSLGEYSALVCAESLGFTDAVRLVNLRGQYMQEAVPEGAGAMAAVLNLADEEIASACEEAAQGEVVAAANFNSPGQVVIAGHAAAVDRAVVLCQERGAKRAMRLAVSVPSHCDLMRPAAERLAAALTDIEVKAPAIPVVQNVSAQVPETEEQVKQNLVGQLYCPVRWVDCVNLLVSKGIERVVECGPGKVLTGLNKRIARQLDGASLANADSLEKRWLDNSAV